MQVPKTQDIKLNLISAWKITYISYISAKYLVSISSNTLPSQTENAPRLFYAPETVSSGEAGQVGIQDVYRKPNGKISCIEGTGFHFWKKVVSFFLKRWFSHVQFFETNMMFNGNFSVFQTREWLVTPWVMTCLWLKHPVHVRSILSWNGEFERHERQSSGWTHGEVTNRLGCFYCFKRAKKTCFCCGWTSFVWEFCWEGDGAGRSSDEWWGWMLGWKCRECGFFHCHNMSSFVSSSENGLKPKTIMSAWKI